MNKKLTDYVIDLVEILNKQQKQVFHDAGAGVEGFHEVNAAVFFFNDTATTEIYTEIYTLSLHDALPSFQGLQQSASDSCS